MVHGLSRKIAGCNPRRNLSSGFITVAMNSSRFIPINSCIGLKRKPRELLYVITIYLAF